MTDDTFPWILSFQSGKNWFDSLRSEKTKEVYLTRLKQYLDAVGKNPDELIQLKIDGLKNVEQDAVNALKEKNPNISVEIYLDKDNKIRAKIENVSENKETAEKAVEEHIEKWCVDHKEETEKLMDWSLQTSISWGVVLFTAIFGMLELLPEIRVYSGSFGTLLTIILPMIYIGFLIAFFFSIQRIGYLYGELRAFQNEFPKALRERFGEQIYNKIVNEKTFLA